MKEYKMDISENYTIQLSKISENYNKRKYWKILYKKILKINSTLLLQYITAN